jgi:CTP:molybdopterin cytidylyltransferase MocA
VTPTDPEPTHPAQADAVPTVVGLVLAAGAGRRMGTPKALLSDDLGRPRTLVAARGLLAAGCSDVLVVLGAAAADAERLLTSHVDGGEAVSTVVAAEWADGMGLSLRRGLAELASAPRRTSAALVTLVDLPDVGPAVHRRVLQVWREGGSSPEALLRATYARRPGHPVLLGRGHWLPLTGELTGDFGAQRYLARHTVREVSCEDLASGRDIDRPEDLLTRDADPTGESR